MKEIDVIYSAAILLPPSERGAYLDRACGKDRALRLRVEAMLEESRPLHDAAEGTPTLREEDDSLNREPVEVAPIQELEGTTIGNYRLLQRIGEGGMGVVYMADQEHPVRRRVAVKIVKLGMDTEAVVARFEAERQALAMMDHPNIARVLDAGATSTGRPYFVMELVQGVPITNYCDRNKLSLRERLQLFIPVCKAIQSAHQKGIIHRDLKPSNVMVTLHHGDPMPKVIDFGVAKAINQRLTDKTVFTRFGAMVGTPAYMSPEQAEMSSLDVDTRADVYSLGVLLYELLTGSTPISSEKLQSLGPSQVHKVLAEVEPEKPSTRLSTMVGARRGVVTSNRGLGASARRDSIPSDLDWIVMKCLEKDRRRRYDTVNGLTMDIGRHLSNEPVLARPPSAWYQFQKSFRRNRVVFLGTAAVFVALLVGGSLAIVQAIRARAAEVRAKADAQRAVQAEKLAKDRMEELVRERDFKTMALRDAEAITGYLTRVFRSPDPTRDGRSITVAETLDRAVARLDSDLKEQPAQRARLQSTFAQTYAALGLYKEAVRLQEHVHAYAAATLGSNHVNTVAERGVLAGYLSYAGRNQEALHLNEADLEIHRQRYGLKSMQTIGTLHSLAIRYAAVGRAEEALKMREEVVAFYRGNKEATDNDLLPALYNLALSYDHAGRTEEALKLREEVYAGEVRRSGPDSLGSVLAMSSLSSSYLQANRHSEAFELSGKALALSQKFLGPEHPDTLSLMMNRAHQCLQIGRLEGYVPLCEESLRVSRKLYGENNATTSTAARRLASAYLRVGRTNDAVQVWRQQRKHLLTDLQSRLDDTSYTLGAATTMAWFGMNSEYTEAIRRILTHAKDSTEPTVLDRAAKAASLLPDTAPDLRELALKLGRRSVEVGAKHQYVLYFKLSCGIAEYRAGNHVDAEKQLREIAPVPVRSELIYNTASMYRAMALYRQDKPSEAREVLSQAGRAMLPMPELLETAEVAEVSADVLINWLAYKEARALLSGQGR